MTDSKKEIIKKASNGLLISFATLLTIDFISLIVCVINNLGPFAG